MEMICKSRKGHAASMMTDIMQELRSLEVHKRSKKQFSTTQTRPHRSSTVKHWRTVWKPLLPLHSRPEQVG